MTARWIATWTAAACIAGASAASAEGASLAASWLLDERNSQGVFDWSGNGNWGVLGDTPAAEAEDPDRIQGPLLPTNRALRFDGNDYVTIKDSPSLEPTGLTIAATVRAEKSPGRFRYVFSKGAHSCSAASYGLYTGPDGGITFYISDGERYTRSADGGRGIWDGRWHQVVGSYDGQRLRLFVDGKEVGAPKATNSPLRYGLRDNERFYIGDYGGPCPSKLGFVGDIDAVAIWNRASGPNRTMPSR